MKAYVAALPLALISQSALSAPNLVVGGGFESPPAPALHYLLHATPLGWTGTGDLVAQGYAGAVSSGDGAQWLDLNPGTGAGVGVSQVLALSAGTPYAFSFLYNGGSPSAGFTTEIAYSVKAGATVLLAGTVSTAGMNVYSGSPWVHFSDSFALASDAAVTIKFLPNGVWANGFIDAVSVSVVPEPSVPMLLLSGLVALATRRYPVPECRGDSTLTVTVLLHWNVTAKRR